MNRTEFRFFEPLRVRWAEVDMQHIVFNGHYLMYLDTAVAAYWRALALPYQAAMRLMDGDLYVRKATLEYDAPARYDERLDIGIRCRRIGNSSAVFGGAVFRADKRLVSAELVYVFADPATHTSRPVPAPLREALEHFEAGGVMLDVRVGTWDELGREAQALRTAVFVHEQKIPAELEWDAADAMALHAVAYNRLGMPVGTGRLLEHAPGVGRIGRMAVHAGVRGGGVGQAVLAALMNAARRQGHHSVLLHSQASAEGFYLRQGFAAQGERFEEAGIVHIEMVRQLGIA